MAPAQHENKKRSRTMPARELGKQQGEVEETDKDKPLTKRVATGEARSKCTSTPATSMVAQRLSLPHYAARTNLSSAFRSVRKDQTADHFPTADSGRKQAGRASHSHSYSAGKRHVEEAYGDAAAEADDEASSGIELLSDLDGDGIDLVDKGGSRSQTPMLNAGDHDDHDDFTSPTAARRTRMVAPPVVVQVCPCSLVVRR